jgi:serine/threonine-protein kinase
VQEEPIEAAPPSGRELFRQLGRYELLSPLGAGGTAAVYLARTRGAGGFENKVAVKLFYGDVQAGDLAADSIAEAKLAVRIRHPHVVSVLDVGTSPQGTYLVMEHVEGETVDWLHRNARKRGQRIPDPIAFRILLDALAGLHAAHELEDETGKPLQVVHRDFAPQNILVGVNGIAKITDFGIAKVADASGRTRTGLIKGRITHMAPEQVRGQPLDRRCDVWAAGVVAWELLTGERLYSPTDEDATLLRIVNEDPPRLAELRPDLPRGVDEAIAHALCRDASQRCPTADALRRALLQAAPEVAEHDDVARYLRSFPAEREEERRRRVESIRALRDKLRGRRGQRRSTEPPTELPADGPEDATTLQVAAPLDARDVTRPKGSRRRWAIVAAALAATAGLAALLSTRDAVPPLPAPAGAPTAEPTVESVAPEPPVAAVPETLILHANAPIQELRVGRRSIAIAKPSTTVELALDHNDGALVEARTRDGREATVRVPKGAREVQLEFPSASARARHGVRKKPGSGCNPPYYFDAQGVKHLRTECL